MGGLTVPAPLLSDEDAAVLENFRARVRESAAAQTRLPLQLSSADSQVNLLAMRPVWPRHDAPHALRGGDKLTKGCKCMWLTFLIDRMRS